MKERTSPTVVLCKSERLMIPGTYLIKQPLLGIAFEGDQRIAVPVPADAIVRVIGPAADIAPLVTVFWSEKTFAMFAADLEKDAERIFFAES